MKKNSTFFATIASILLMLFAGCSRDIEDNGSQCPSPKEPELNPTTRIVSVIQAQEFANKAFMSVQSKDTDRKTRSSAPDNSAKVEPILGANGEPVMYAVNFGDNEGFMLLSADKESEGTMLVFNTSGNLNPSDIDPASPIGLMIKQQSEIIARNINEGIDRNSDGYKLWEGIGTDPDVEVEIELVVKESSKTRGTHPNSWNLAQTGPYSSIVNCTWAQNNGYNADAPIPNVDLAGCPAVAIGILCRTWYFPYKYDYYAMPNSLPKTTQSNAISWMFRDIARNIPGYKFNSRESGANGPNILTGLQKIGYSRAKFDDYNFDTVYGNISANYPVLLGGFSDYGGHIWIADGYWEQTWKYTKWRRNFWGKKKIIAEWNEYQDLFYMNWGWNGQNNGWVDQESWPTYSNGRKMWYDLYPY